MKTKPTVILDNPFDPRSRDVVVDPNNTPIWSKNDRKNLYKEMNPTVFKEQSAAFFRYKVNYPESFAQTDNDEHDPRFLEQIRNKKKALFWLPACSFSFLKLQCADGHQIAKAIYCGREWCPTCGQKNSLYHKRRIKLFAPRLTQQIQMMGYMVITIPIEIRNKFMSKFDLNQFRTFIRRKFKRENFAGTDKGFMRWHFAGDCKKCEGRKCDACNHTGADHEYHPHLNILFNTTGFIVEEKLKQLKKEIGSWFRLYAQWDDKRDKKDENYGLANVYYKYSDDVGKQKHWVKYVTRATWRFYNEKICTIIKGYRVGVCYGKFEPVIPEDTASAIEHKCCPVCLKQDGVINKLIKYGFEHKDKFVHSSYREIDPGIFHLINNSS